MLHDEPARAILGFAERVQADLIALGSHGRRFMERLRLGSVAEAMLRAARCSVLIVSSQADARETTDVPA